MAEDSTNNLKIQKLHENAPSEDSSQKGDKKKERLLGFPKIIFTQFDILNRSSYFKENYSADKFDLLLIAVDDKRAAIVHVSDGAVQVEAVKNKPEEIKPVKKAIKPRITTDIETFMGLAMNKVNPIKAIFKGKLKIRKIKVVLKFTKYFSIIAHEQKKETQK